MTRSLAAALVEHGPSSVAGGQRPDEDGPTSRRPAGSAAARARRRRARRCRAGARGASAPAAATRPPPSAAPTGPSPTAATGPSRRSGEASSTSSTSARTASSACGRAARTSPGRASQPLLPAAPRTIGTVRPRPNRLERLPEQYFATLLDRVAAVATPTAARPSSTSAAAIPRSGRRRTWSRRSGRRPPARTSTATPRSAACRGCARRSPNATATVYGAAVDPEREVAIVPGNEDGDRRALDLARRSRRHDPAARPVLPRLSLGRRARGRRRSACCRSTRPPAGAPDLDSAPPAAAAFLNYPSNPCAVCAPSGLFEEAVAYGRADGDGDRPRRRLHRPRLRRPRAAELPRDAGRERRRRRAVDDVEDLRHGRLADRLRARQRRARRAGQPAERPPARRHLRAAAGGGDRRADGAAGLRRGAAGDLRAPPRPARSPRCPSRRCARAPSTSGCGCPTG